MSWVEQRYNDISPVTLQVVGGAISSSLYCEEVEGLSQVESFLVELYRCKICQFTCGLKTAISSHLLLRHDPPTLTCLTGPDGREVAQDGAEPGMQQMESPYQLDLNGDSKQSDEDDEFLLYNMLDNMSPPTCDMSTEEGLQVAHTCEVSTLFEEEEESSVFPLKGSAVDMSCPINPSSTQEEMDQSAHLMTLGLCRISAVRPPAAAPSDASCLQQSRTERRTEMLSPGHRRLLCLLCPVTLPSRRLLDVHVRSHRAVGGFGCIRCNWTTDSWEALEPHWRNHCRRGRRRKRRVRGKEPKRREEQEHHKEKQWREEHQGKKRSCLRRSAIGGLHSTDRWRAQQIEQAETKKAELSDRSSQTANQKPACDFSSSVPSQTSSLQTCSSQTVSVLKKKEQQEVESKRTGLTCSLCHRKFSSKLTLKRHLGVHGAEKPFTCPHCPYSSRLKASLMQHLRTHTGEKPFRCSECPYASIDRSSLLRHSRTHSQEKPYSCPLCNYSSIQKKSLDLHARRHHTGEVFPCQQCEYSSPDRQLLLKHIRRRHAPSQLQVL
ncbi:oocyte zinc finger protein XlCOF6 [Girardinichthys multiradiatus]|uniref:oocyte zinc finger protein XlCOF6 n=1 Tax=Girardinichthys multiradiatus TaxID=208333 RepID=UPI001FAC84E7|nr:oocyte zinc finger protein XlCOF6 [Girardinichthys multiradiatus]XP_047224677.1 oocyte zinc finger protein XlCOF6 [Girardinichthys multiradiatus]